MGPTHMAANVTTVDFHKQVRSWRLLRAVMELLIPTCNCSFIQHHPHNKPTPHSPPPPSSSSSSSRSSYSSTTSSSTFLTGTIYGYKKGKVKFGIQSNTSSILLIELAVPTTILAREMRDGVLRIALESISNNNNNNNNNTNNKNYNNNNYNNNNSSSSSSLLEMPVWKMYCNGRRVGFAVKRKPCKADMDFFRKVKNVVVGAGIVKGKEIGCNNDDDIMYLRGTFETFRGSSHAQSFHLIDPDGNVNQDLSIFFLRSL